MTAVRRLIVPALVCSLALSGPLAPFAAAQQPSVPPAQPDIFEEALKATGQRLPSSTQQAPPAAEPAPSTAPPPPGSTSYQPAPSTQPERAKASDGRLNDEFYSVFAGVATGFLFSGRAMTCTLGGVVSVGVLIFTLGSGYRAATRVIEEGCGGKWTVTADDLRPTQSMVDLPIQTY